MNTIITILTKQMSSYLGKANILANHAIDYDLIVLEDEATPLGAHAGGIVNYYLPTLIAVAILAICVSVGLWFSYRNRYKRRLLELRAKFEDEDKTVPILIKSIKDEITRMEAELVSEMI